jgi:hypothetical protein
MQYTKRKRFFFGMIFLLGVFGWLPSKQVIPSAFAALGGITCPASEQCAVFNDPKYDLTESGWKDTGVTCTLSGGQGHCFSPANAANPTNTTQSPVVSNSNTIPTTTATDTAATSNTAVAAGSGTKPLENVPGFELETGNATKNFPQYINSIYNLAVWIVGISALFMGTFGAFVYLTSAGNTSQVGKGKGIIKDALIGMVLLLSAWLILNTINPDLVNLNFSSLSSGGGTNSGTGGTGGGNTGTGTKGQCPSGLNKGSGVDSQCTLVSPELNAVLTCMVANGASGPIGSITSQWAKGDLENSKSCCGRGDSTQSDKTQCPHAPNSCHHGCARSSFSPAADTIGYSQAIDYQTPAGETKEKLCKIARIAWKCGAGTNIWGPKPDGKAAFTCTADDTGPGGTITWQTGHATHLHIPTGGCNG